MTIYMIKIVHTCKNTLKFKIMNLVHCESLFLVVIALLGIQRLEQKVHEKSYNNHQLKLEFMLSISDHTKLFFLQVV